MKRSVQQSLVPDNEEARQYVQHLKFGEPVMVTVKRPRNIQFHRKFFALLNVAFENQDKYEDFEAFRKEVTMRAGYWEEHVHITGQISYTAKSISFASMDELEFADLYDKAVTAIIQHFMVGADEHELTRAVEEVLSFS